MSERSGFFNAEIDSNGQYDRTYKAEQFAEYFSAFIGNGVYITPASQLKVIPVGNELAIYISVGNAYINGYFYANDDKIYRKLSNPNGVNPRIDRVVLRLNFKTRKISVDILEGTAASNPSAKGITRSQDVYELALADVYVASNAITVTEANITDLRNNSLMCGYVKGVVDQIDTTNLFSQFQNSFDTWFANIKSQLSGDVAANLQRQIDENRERLSFNANKNNVTNLKDTIESPMLVTNATINLLNPTLQTTTHNGVTCTNNGDGTYTLNGTASGRAIFAVCGENFYALPYFVGDAKIVKQIFSEQSIPGSDGGYAKGCYFAMQGKDQVANIYIDEIVVDDYVNKMYRPIINVSEGITVDNVVFKPMLTTNLNATYDDFVPYSGYEIKTCGKNLLIPALQTTTHNGVTCTNNGDGTYTFNGTATSNSFFDINTNISINKGTKYKVVCFKDEDYVPNKITSCVRRVNTTREYIFNNGSFVPDAENCWLWINIAKNVTVSNLVAKPMITADLNATYDNFVQYQDGGTVHIDSTTEFPLLGPKSFDGETNIISPGNVEVTYATSKGGKGFLESLLANSNIKDKLDAKIEDNTNQIDANTTTLNKSVLPELNNLINNVAFKEQMQFNSVDNKLNLQIIQQGLFLTKGAMTGVSNTFLVGCVARVLTSVTLTTEPVTFASFDMNQMFQSGLITRAYFNKPAIALPGEPAVAQMQIIDEDLEIGARAVNVAIVGVQSTNIQASVPFMINNLEIIAIRQTQSASQASAQPASRRIRRIPKSKINEISLMSLDDEVESDTSAVNDEQFVYDEETLALMEKLDNDPNWTRIIFKN